MNIVRCRAAACVLCAIAAMAGPAVAQANGTTVTTAIKAQDKVIRTSSAFEIFKGGLHPKTAAQAKVFVAKIGTLRRLFEHAATVVDGASTSSPQQKQGQQDWVSGVREVADGFGEIQVEFKDLEAGKTATAKAAVRKYTKLVNAGNAKDDKAEKLLGLPNND